MDLVTIILFGLLTFITQCIEAITGFGSTVTALPFGIALVGLNVARPVFAVTTLVMCSYIAIRERRYIKWKIYFRIIAIVLIGMPLGMFAFSHFNEWLLRIILAIVVILISLRGLIVHFVNTSTEKNEQESSPTSTESEPISTHTRFDARSLWLLCGGIVHGAFASGGPFIIIYTAKALPDKNNFRATMCMVWVTLNTIITSQDIISGHFTVEVLILFGISLLFTVASIFVGNILHKKCNADVFTVLIYSVLFISGVFMLYAGFTS